MRPEHRVIRCRSHEKHGKYDPCAKCPSCRVRRCAHRSVPASRVIGPAVRKAAGYVFLVPLLILLWFVFYQNLPEDLNGMAFKPFSTLGTIDRILKIGTIVISCAVIATQWSRARLLMKNVNPGLAAFMVLIPLSALWSIDSAATLLRFTTLIGIVLLCLAIPLAGWDRRRLQQVVLPPVMTILVLSLLIGILSPESVKEIGTDISLQRRMARHHFSKEPIRDNGEPRGHPVLPQVACPGKTLTLDHRGNRHCAHLPASLQEQHITHGNDRGRYFSWYS